MSPISLAGYLLEDGSRAPWPGRRAALVEPAAAPGRVAGGPDLRPPFRFLTLLGLARLPSASGGSRRPVDVAPSACVESRPWMETITSYFAAWNETNADARRRLLERSISDDAELVDPTGRWRGIDGFSTRISNHHACRAGQPRWRGAKRRRRAQRRPALRVEDHRSQRQPDHGGPRRHRGGMPTGVCAAISDVPRPASRQLTEQPMLSG